MEWLQTLGPSALVVLGGIVTWVIRSKSDELKAIEDRLAVERRKIYSDILEPYIKLFTPAVLEDPTEQAAVMRTITGFNYRKTSFELVLIGSDEVARAYNDLMQFTFTAESSPGSSRDVGAGMMERFGHLLLAVRRSLGNRKTDLDAWEMLESMIKEIDSVRGAAPR